MTEEMEKRTVEGIERIASGLERIVKIVGRSSTLRYLIDTKRIRTIKTKNGRKLIPASEIRRFTENFDAGHPGLCKPPTRASRQSAESLRQAILAIKL